MTALLRYQNASLLVLLLLFTSGSSVKSALAQPAEESCPTVTNAEEDADGTSLREIWTCAMHPQIRQPNPGRCPIRGMNQIPARETATDGLATLISRQEMLAIRLKHNPDVRASQARVEAAEAELDRTRFDVLQKITAFRTKWGNQRSALQAALREVQSAEAALRSKDSPATSQLAASAREKYFQQRAKLAEVEAELPFLLGQRGIQLDKPAGSESDRLIRDQLLPLARQTQEVQTREYQEGKRSILELAATHRQITELEARLAETNAKRITVVQAQKALLESIRDVAEQRYKVGSASQSDVLSLDLELAKLDLWLLELKGR